MGQNNNKPKFAFVVQRFGYEVIGGSETLCRQVAERLSKYYDIDILTTCALDYVTWRNHYHDGLSYLKDGLTVIRFKVDHERDIKEFNRLSAYVLDRSRKHNKADEIDWMKKQGPDSSSLHKFVEKHKDDYDLFIFFTYLYSTAYFGLPQVSEKAVLVPTAHDERVIYLDIFNDLFKLPKALIYLTEEEKRFVEAKFNIENIPSVVIGTGIAYDGNDTNASRFKVPDKPYILYCGRIEESKGCKELIEYFQRYKKLHSEKSSLQLVLVGRPVMQLPKDKNDDLKVFSDLSEADKLQVILQCRVFVMPSRYESFSIATLEAMKLAKPVLVHANCPVLKGHCIKSNGGLYYSSYEEFDEALTLLLLDNNRIATILGNNGREYVEKYYNWNTIEHAYLSFLNSLLIAKGGTTEKK